MKKKLRPPFKIHGGKYFLSQWIISQFPENYQEMVYLEPFCGAASVLLNKEPSKEEIINDLDKDIITLFKILRDQFPDFIKKLNKVKYSEKNFLAAMEPKYYSDEISRAIDELVVRRMSRGGLKKAFSWSNRERGGQPGEINSWETIIKALPEISERLKDVYILDKNAIELIETFNETDTLVYVDPPYLPETRESNNVYKHEMTIDDHIALSDVLNGFKGKALVSGYPSRLYNKLYKSWKCEKKKMANHSSQQKTKPIKLELLWKNY